MNLTQKAIIAREHGMSYGKLEALLHELGIKWENHNTITVPYKSDFSRYIHKRCQILKNCPDCKDSKCKYLEKCYATNIDHIEYDELCECKKKEFETIESIFKAKKRG